MCRLMTGFYSASDMNGYLKVLLHIFIVSNEDEILLSFRKFILITLDLRRHKKCASRSKYPATGWEGVLL